MTMSWLIWRRQPTDNKIAKFAVKEGAQAKSLVCPKIPGWRRSINMMKLSTGIWKTYSDSTQKRLSRKLSTAANSFFLQSLCFDLCRNPKITGLRTMKTPLKNKGLFSTRRLFTIKVFLRITRYKCFKISKCGHSWKAIICRTLTRKFWGICMPQTGTTILPSEPWKTRLHFKSSIFPLILILTFQSCWNREAYI